jgi:hypothetical protein
MATRMQQRRGTASQWISSNAGSGPILNAGEIGWESDTNKFKIGDGVSYWSALTYFVDATDVIASSLGAYLQDSDIGASQGVVGLNASLDAVVPGASIIMEGATDNAFETTLTVTDPTADRTITFPDATGTVAILDATQTFTNKTLTSPTVSGLTLSDASIVIEGATANDYETTLTVTDPTADRTITFPDATGTVALTNNKLDAFAATTSAELRTVISDETGTGGLVFADTPTLVTPSLGAATGTSLALSSNNLNIGSQSAGLRTTDAYTNPISVFSVDADDDYAQLVVKNTGDGINASSDVIVYASNGVDSSGWIDIGITSPSFSDPEFTITGPNDGYIFMEAPEVFTESVTVKSLTDNVATLTIGPNDFRVGMPVTVTGVDATFNGTYTITARTSTTFSYAKTASNVSTEACSGTAVAGTTGDGNLVIATGANGTHNHIVFAAGGLSSDNTQMTIFPDVNVHIEIPTPSTSPTTGALTVVGGVGIQGDMNIEGNVAIEGTITFGGAGTTVETSNLAVTDPAVFVGTGNQADIVDLAFIGEYAITIGTITKTVSNKALTSDIATLTTSAEHTYLAGDVVVVSGVDATFNGTYNIIDVPTNVTFTYAKTASNVTSAAASGSAAVSARRKFSGIARDASDGVLKAFKDATTKPTSTVNFSEAGLGYSDLRIGALTASSVSLGDGSALGTPVSVTLTNATGLPVTSGISGFGTGVATFLATPSSANFASMITDEIGTGNVILSDMATSSQSASYTLVLEDKAKVVEMSVGSANNLTVPLNASVAFPVGTQIHIVQTGSGQTTVVATAGVTINSATTLKMRAQWAAATLIKRAENTWVILGDLATS